MADYQFNTNLGPAAQQNTSLADMVNLARGVQAYQQQGQLNPLQLEKAQMEVEQAQKLNPLAVKKATAETATSELNLSSAQTEKLYGLAGGVLNDPRLKSKDAKDVMGALYEAKQRASTYGLPAEAVEGVFNPLFKVAQSGNPAAVRQSINNIVDTQISAEGKRAMQTGGTVEINGIKYQYAPASGRLEQIGAGGAPAAPAAPMNPASSVNPAKPVAAQTSGLVRQDMPVPSGGVAQMNTQQTARFEEGQLLQKESTSLAQAASEAKQTSRKIKENIAAASGSKPGQLIRSAGKFIAGSEQLDELVKNLADNQMRQAALMGASSATDQARQVVALANGSENITAGALAQIVQRADATSTALEKFNAGLNKYYDKAGTYNGPIHARNFKQAWAENYDPRIFMVQNINSSDMSGAEKQIQLQAVLKGTTEEERKALAKKAETIKRLERGDF
jgi:hypothetical protein